MNPGREPQEPYYSQFAYHYYWTMMAHQMRQQSFTLDEIPQVKVEQRLSQKQTQSQNKVKFGKMSSKQKKQVPVKAFGDDDWSPKSKNRKIKRHNQEVQKQDRNAFSHVIRCFLKFLTTQKAKEELDRLKQHFQTSVNIQDFYKFMELGNVNHQSYVGLKSVLKMIRKDGKDKGQTSRIFVMMFKKYANSGLRVHFLTSSKLKQTNRPLVLQKIRQTEQAFVDALLDQKKIC